MLELALERGEIESLPPDDVAFSLIAGACYHRAFVLNEALSASFQRTVVDFALDGLRAYHR